MPLPTVFDSCGDFTACRERTPGVPRKKAYANAVLSVDGKDNKDNIEKIYKTNYYNPCSARPSNARFVIF